MESADVVRVQPTWVIQYNVWRRKKYGDTDMLELAQQQDPQLDQTVFIAPVSHTPHWRSNQNVQQFLEGVGKKVGYFSLALGPAGDGIKNMSQLTSEDSFMVVDRKIAAALLPPGSRKPPKRVKFFIEQAPENQLGRDVELKIAWFATNLFGDSSFHFNTRLSTPAEKFSELMKIIPDSRQAAEKK